LGRGDVHKCFVQSAGCVSMSQQSMEEYIGLVRSVKSPDRLQTHTSFRITKQNEV
jgi:hypothetical protein